MPVEFLTDDEAAAYGRYTGPPSRAELERVFFLDDKDRAQIAQRRGQHMKLGVTLQLMTVRWLGTFLEDPLEVPGVVLDFVAEQGARARRRRGDSIRTIAAGVKVSVGVVHKTLAAAQSA